MLAVDTETTSLNQFEASLICASFWDEKGGRVYKHGDPKLRRELLSPEPKVFWNARYDIPVLHRNGYEIRGKVIDAMFNARVCMPLRKSLKLKNWAGKVLNEPCTSQKALKAALRRYKEFSKIPWEVLEPYALDDARYTYELQYVFGSNMDEDDLIVSEREHRVLPIVMEMEEVGIGIDQLFLDQLVGQVADKMRYLHEELVKYSGNEEFRPTRAADIRDMLFDKLEFDPVYFTPKQHLPQVDENALSQINHPAARTVLEWRKHHKALSTYLTNFESMQDAKGSIHPSFNQVGALTGRFSSSNPNFQNIPRPGPSLLGQTRGCFKARPGYKFLFIDYDQVELRLAAHFSEEPDMIETILSGGDLHGLTCERVFSISKSDPDWSWKRQASKTLNFSILYGSGADQLMNTLRREAGISVTVFEAMEMITSYKREYRGITKLFDQMEELGLYHGTVLSPYNRRIPIPPRSTYMGVNYLIQGTAADLIKESLIACHDLLRGRLSRILATIHDEIVFEIHEKEQHLVPVLLSLMEEPTKFLVPLTCSASSAFRWNEKRSISKRKLSQWTRSSIRS